MRLTPLALITLVTLSAVGIVYGPAVIAAEADPASVELATIGGEAITLEDLDYELAGYFKTLADDGKGGELPDADAILRRMIQNRLLEQEGYRIGADQRFQVRNAINQFLRSKSTIALLDSISAGAASEGSAELDSILSQKSEMRHYSHIIVPQEIVAQAIRDSLDRGLPFEDLARRNSKDSSAANGGDLGWAREGSYVPAFDDAASKLSIGEIVGPIETSFGWHIIRLEGTRQESLGNSDEMASAMRHTLEKDNRMSATRVYLDGLRERYGVVIHEDLVETLNFGSEDPQELADLRADETVIVEMPGAELTVKKLNRSILFTHFHGLSGKPDADETRDRFLSDWIDEILLDNEARTAGLHLEPSLAKRAKQMEREQLREEVLVSILNVEFRPSEDEVDDFYGDNRELFKPKPRIKLRSALLMDEARAEQFRAQIERGAKLRWLSSRFDGVVEDATPYPEDWIDPVIMQLSVESLEVGKILGPTQEEEGWAVAVVQSIEETAPLPLADCRAQVVQTMKRNKNRSMIKRAMERLEEGTEVVIKPNAGELVQEHLRAKMARVNQTESAPAADKKRGKGERS